MTLKKHLTGFLTFSTIGAFVTSLSLSANFVLLKFFKTPLIPTYVTIYIITILISFLLNSKYTFKSDISSSNLIRYYLIYGSGMMLGVVLLLFFKSLITFENWVYPFMVIPFTMLWNYSVSSKLLKKNQSV